MSKPLVSIIVPVYNVDKYLNRCVKNLVEQTYEKIEIILVDDGSPDNSGALCDEWAKKDGRIRVIHKENGGLSDARNTGTDIAQGEYIFYIDSDDYINIKTIDYLYNLIRDYNADVVHCGYIRTSEDFVDYPEEENITVFHNGKDACVGLFTRWSFMTTAWGALIKKELAKAYKFPFGRIQEDESVTYKYYYYANCVVVSTRQMYAYYQNPNGIISTNVKRNIRDKLTALEERVLFFEQNNESELLEYSLKTYLRDLFAALAEDIPVDKILSKKLLKMDLLNKRENFKSKAFICLYLVIGNHLTQIIKVFKKFKYK